MADISTTVLTTIHTAQLALKVIQTLLGLTAYQFPATCTLKNNSYTDYIVVGAGSAGSVVASRLSENEDISVTLLEAGALPPIESQLPGVFPLLPWSSYDYNYTAEDDGYSAQNTQLKKVPLTQGKGVGGSGLLDHLIHVIGAEYDYSEWASITGDASWNYKNILEYMKMQENLLDKEILKSAYASKHGTGGYKDVQREKSSTNVNYLKAFEEMGHKIKIDVSDPSSLGCSEPLLFIADGKRKNNAVGYLGAARGRKNLCLSVSSTVTKILFSNGAAIGVQVVDANGDTYILYARKEVIVSAGAINTPKLLLHSGIGDKEQLENFNIPLVADLPAVGKNMQDHLTVQLVYQMESTNETTPASNPHMFPVPMNQLFAAIDPMQDHPDYQALNLIFPHDSTALVQLCSGVFQYSDEVCNKFYEASNGRNILFGIQTLLKPKSRGTVELRSSDFNDPPKVTLGLLSDEADLILMGKILKNFHQVMDTTYFKSVNASLIDLGMCSDAEDFWQCYAVAMSNTLWHFCGTCAMGYVLDSDLRVKGINGLRVVDASSMPTIPSGNILAPLTMLAEKAAALIKADQQRTCGN